MICVVSMMMIDILVRVNNAIALGIFLYNTILTPIWAGP